MSWVFKDREILDGKVESCVESGVQVFGYVYMFYVLVVVVRNLLNVFKQIDENCDIGQQSECFYVNFKFFLVRLRWFF